MLNIVIPMAGAGSRFKRAGYKDPKPLIKVGGQPMIKLVIDNLTPDCDHRFIFICQRQHVLDYGLEGKLASWSNNCKVVCIDGLTDGAACTVLEAIDFIDRNDPLMIANSDQYIDVDINQYLRDMSDRDIDGIIMTMDADDPKWSFVGHEDGLVNKVVEKEVISNEATVGIYNFRKGSDFISAAQSMIEKDLRVNGEFYVAPVYNVLIEHGQKIGIFNIGSERNGMYGLGIPADLDYFLTTDLSKNLKVIVS